MITCAKIAIIAASAGLSFGLLLWIVLYPAAPLWLCWAGTAAVTATALGVTQLAVKAGLV